MVMTGQRQHRAGWCWCNTFHYVDEKGHPLVNRYDIEEERIRQQSEGSPMPNTQTQAADEESVELGDEVQNRKRGIKRTKIGLTIPELLAAIDRPYRHYKVERIITKSWYRDTVDGTETIVEDSSGVSATVLSIHNGMGDTTSIIGNLVMDGDNVTGIKFSDDLSWKQVRELGQALGLGAIAIDNA